MSIDNCKLITLPRISDPRGTLSFIEGSKHIPFDIQRVFYSFAIPSPVIRGEHAHKKLQQFLIAISGSFDVILDDGQQQTTIHLSDPGKGLYIPPMIWASQSNFGPNSVCMVLASDIYDESDYYRNYNDFLQAVKNG